MKRILPLSPLVVTKIAAGEVIERPASVVKEMLENSVDAGATRIDVDIEQGGVELIRIVDDGGGIHPDDLPLAFQSHATSKLADADDLFRIRTLGFRGEALASIGGVAQVRLQSRPPGLGHGAEMTCNGGEMSPVQPWNGAPGTRIEVRHLFYNVPARRKFLRTTSTEMGHIAEAVTRLALAQPNLHVTLRHNGKLNFEVPATATLHDRILLFFGPEVADQLYGIEMKQGTVTLRGYIADPACERGTAKLQYLFLNGRCIRDRTLAHALQEGYRGLLMTGRYAVAFLFLDMPPDLVDVNVHPTKSEVRFRDAQALHHLVFAAVRERLRKEDLTARLQVPSTLNAPQPPSPTLPSPPPLSSRLHEPPWALQSQAPPEEGLPFDTAAPTPAVAAPPSLPTASSAPTAPPPTVGAPPPPIEQVLIPAPGTFKAIQLYNAYLVVETPAGMLVIDQHALHERILFEQLQARMRTGPLEMQHLLIPEPVDLTAEQAARLLEQRESLAELGLEVSDFGGGTVLVGAYPAVLGKRSPESILKAVVDHLSSKDRLPSREVLLNDLLSLMACHSAVRSGDPLTAEQIAALVAQRHLAEDTHHCPHGRPTALLFTRQDLDRQFRRV